MPTKPKYPPVPVGGAVHLHLWARGTCRSPLGRFATLMAARVSGQPEPVDVDYYKVGSAKIVISEGSKPRGATLEIIDVQHSRAAGSLRLHAHVVGPLTERQRRASKATGRRLLRALLEEFGTPAAARVTATRWTIPPKLWSEASGETTAPARCV